MEHYLGVIFGQGNLVYILAGDEDDADCGLAGLLKNMKRVLRDGAEDGVDGMDMETSRFAVIGMSSKEINAFENVLDDEAYMPMPLDRHYIGLTRDVFTNLEVYEGKAMTWSEVGFVKDNVKNILEAVEKMMAKRRVA